MTNGVRISHNNQGGWLELIEPEALVLLQPKDTLDTSSLPQDAGSL